MVNLRNLCQTTYELDIFVSQKYLSLFMKVHLLARHQQQSAIVLFKNQKVKKLKER